MCFEFEYVEKVVAGDGTQTRQPNWETVWAVDLPTGVPQLSFAPEGLFGGKLSKLWGGGDIEFDNEEFNRTFRVLSTDRTFAHAVFHPQLMQDLVRMGKWSWRFCGSVMLSTESGGRNPEDIIPRLDSMAYVIDQIPEWVWQGIVSQRQSDV